MAMRNGYCPYGLNYLATELRLSSQLLHSAFGNVHVVTGERSESRTATLFLHGVGSTWTTWVPLLRAGFDSGLARDAILVDLPGFGTSENTYGSLPSQLVGAELLRIVSELGYSSVRIVGHSMGGFLTLDIATTNDDRIESIHLAAGAYFSVIRTVQRPYHALVTAPVPAITYWSQLALAKMGDTGLRSLAQINRIGVFPAFLRSFARHPFQLKRSVVDSLCHDQHPASFLLAAKNGIDYNADRSWATIKCPIRAVFGRSDHLVPPRDMIELTEIQPSARAFIIDEASHLVHIEQPEMTFQCLFG